tara:strand:+ start:175 stop:2505 length:2331 start_codon:yes stop_codon:yes gene_type:complete
MAVFQIKHNGTRLSNADGNTDFVNLLSSGQVIDETDIFYQLSTGNTIGASSKKISNAYPPEGLKYFGTAIDWTTSASGLVLYKVIATNSKALYENGAPSSRLYAGSGNANTNNSGYSFDLYGNDDYPSKGGFVLYLWDITIDPYRVADTSAPTLTAITQFGFKGAFTAQSRGENVIMDAVEVGYGLSVIGGTATDPRVSFNDIVDFDEGSLNNRFGYVSTDEGNIKVLGKIVIGRDVATTPVPTEDISLAVATGFEDSNQTIVFPYMAVSGESTGIEIDLHQSCSATLTQCTFSGKGTGGTFYFNTETDITANSDVAGMADIFEEGDYVVVDSYGGTETPGITNGTNYYVGRIAGSSTSADNYGFYSTRQASLSGESVGQTIPPTTLSISTATNGEVWGVKKVLDNNPIFTARRYAQAPPTGNSASAFFDSCTFDSFSRMSLTSAVTAVDCNFLNIRSINKSGEFGGAQFWSCNFINHYTDHGESMLCVKDIGSVTSCNFSQDVGKYGHAIETDTAGVYDFKGNFFEGYGPVEKSFEANTDIAANQITINSHPYTSGDAVTYDDNGNTSINGTDLPNDTTVVYVGVVDVNTITLHLNKGDAINGNSPISLTSSVAAETHYLYSADAAIHNTSGGNITLAISDSTSIPSIRNSNNSTTTIQLVKTFTITNIQPGTEIRFIRDSDGFNYAGIEDVSLTNGDVSVGTSVVCSDDPADSSKRQLVYTYDASDTTSFGPAVSFTVKVFALSYEFETFGISSLATGGSQAVSQRVDRNYINR